MTTPGSTETAGNGAFALRQKTRSLSKRERIRARQQEKNQCRNHCVRRLVERYGLEPDVADIMYENHFDQVIHRWDELEVVYLYGTTRVVELQQKAGRFYAVLRPGRITGYHVIATYLTESMVFDNVMGEGPHALRRCRR